MTTMELFLKLANPDDNGQSRWVSTAEFVGDYKGLQLGNGGSWCRRSSALAKKFEVEFDKSQTPGNSIDAIRLNGFNKNKSFNQHIHPRIRASYKGQRCVMLGVDGKSENTVVELDHKDGRKDDWMVSTPETQRPEHFQPLCKAANDIKRQICKTCKVANKRWDAKNIRGNPYSYYEGDENYDDNLGCVGCYQYDPVEYRKTSVRKISQEVCDDILKKLYPEENYV